MGHLKETHDKNYARFIPDGTHEKFAKQWSKESEDDIMIYDEWKATYELEDRGWDIIKTEFIFMDGLKLDHDG